MLPSPQWSSFSYVKHGFSHDQHALKMTASITVDICILLKKFIPGSLKIEPQGCLPRVLVSLVSCCLLTSIRFLANVINQLHNACMVFSHQLDVELLLIYNLNSSYWHHLFNNRTVVWQDFYFQHSQFVYASSEWFGTTVACNTDKPKFYSLRRALAPFWSIGITCRIYITAAYLNAFDGRPQRRIIIVSKWICCGERINSG